MNRSNKANIKNINNRYPVPKLQSNLYREQVDIIDSILDLDLQPTYNSKKDNRFVQQKDPRFFDPKTSQKTYTRDMRNIDQQSRMDETYDYNNNENITKKKSAYEDEIEQDAINNNLMQRLNSELDIKKGNDRKKKNIILKPFVDKGPSLYENLFDNQISDFRGNYARFNMKKY